MTDSITPQVETTEQVVQRLNEIHAYIAGKGVIRERPDGGFEFEFSRAFHEWYARDKHYTLDDKGKDVATTASKIWMASEQRRSFDSIVFKPGAAASDGEYNLWKGWGVKPNADASCDLILRHIREVISSDDAALFDYNIKYDAHMVQRPEEKPGVARVLRGGRGVGKDAYGVLLGRICGVHTAHIGDSERLTARFNSAFESAMLAHVEEAFFAGNPSLRGKLNHIITTPRLRIERKGVEPFEVDSYLRILMTTNEAWAVPAGDDERRYFVTDVSPRYKQKREYFDPLFAEINGAGAGAYLHYLLNVDLTGFDVRDVPQTEALADQKLESLESVGAWWRDELEAESYWMADGGGRAVTKDELFEAYREFAREQRYGRNVQSRDAFFKAFRRMCPVKERRGGTDAMGRARAFVLPTLRIARRAFTEYAGVSRPAGRSMLDVLG